MEDLKKEEIPNGEDTGPEESESNIIEFFEYREGIHKPNLSESLLNLYDLTKIDKELAEIDEEKGDLPGKISELKDRIETTEKKLKENKSIVKSLEKEEKKLQKENKDTEDKINTMTKNIM